jgi:hypothetical protein
MKLFRLVGDRRLLALGRDPRFGRSVNAGSHLRVNFERRSSREPQTVECFLTLSPNIWSLVLIHERSSAVKDVSQTRGTRRNLKDTEGHDDSADQVGEDSGGPAGIRRTRHCAGSGP